MSNPIVFVGCEAFVCEVLGKQTVRVWLRDPSHPDVEFDKDMTLRLDLGANPTDRPEAVEVDNHRKAMVLPGLTTLGPTWPMSKQDRGGVWITKAIFESLPIDMTNRPGSTFPYQWESRLYLPEGMTSARRYSGFHVELVSRSPSDAIFKAWNATDLIDAQSAKFITVDTGNPAHVDTATGVSDNFTVIGQRGKLFLHWDKASEYEGMLISPKLPLGEQVGISYPRLSQVKEG